MHFTTLHHTTLHCTIIHYSHYTALNYTEVRCTALPGARAFAAETFDALINILGRHSKSGFFCDITILLLKTLRMKMANKSLNILIKWVKMDDKFRKLLKS